MEKNKTLDYEAYFMSGLPIDLTSKGLGVVYQPRLKDFLREGLGVLEFSHSFLFNKEMILNKKESIDDLIKDLGKLSFLIVYNEIVVGSGAGDFNLIELLTRSLKLIYKTDDVAIIKTLGKIIINKNIIIGDEEFEFLSDLILEMLRLDKNDLKPEKTKEEDSEILNEFERRAKKYQEKKKGSNDSSLMDIVNIVVHSQSVIDYEKVFDMTVYQLRNSYETVIKKEVFNVNLAHRISPNFKPSEDFKIWEENAKVVRSSLR